MTDGVADIHKRNAAHPKVRGKRLTKGMRTDGLDSGSRAETFDRFVAW